MTVKRYGSVLFDTGLIEMAYGDYVTYSDYQKLVAENAAMRNAINETIGWQESVDASNTESVRLLVAIQTPATYAAIAEIKAQGVDAFANYKKLESEKSGSTLSLEMSIAAKVFAANLRAGRKG